MKKIIGAAALLLAIIAPQIKAADALKVTETTLGNGLTVWLNEDHSQPKVYGIVVVKAGSKDCPNTGIAHYFEHIMFKGTDKIGTTDYASERVWLDSIAAKYEALAQTRDEARRADIQKEINRLSLKAADYAIPNEFPQLISRYGGSELNAGTSYDYTIFHNVFTPQYLPQWVELNSERLIHPVFRLFQGELETVYEEKNMYADDPMSQAMEVVMKEFAGNHPYAYPIIGSTENLKNPRLSEMEAFFKKYYVASNMGLILCGDFDAASVLPLLEKSFGRIERGVPPTREIVPLEPLQGARTVKIKLPIPIVKGSLVAFRAPGAKDADAMPLNVAMSLLSNSNGSGLLDSLVNVHKMLAAEALNMSLNDGGGMGFMVVPKFPLGSLKNAETEAWQQIDKLKKGEFSDKMLVAAKLEKLRDMQTSLENIDKRGEMMATVFSQGLTWNEYLNREAAVSRLTRNDIVRIANKYFTDSYIRFEKSYGSYPKDKVKKPGFAPIIPKNAGATSAYAGQLEQMPAARVPVRLIDFEKDVQTVKLTPHASLYVKGNPVNDVFDLSLIYHKGTLADPKLAPLAVYLQAIGTDSLTKQDLAAAFQQIGTTFRVEAAKNIFEIKLSGFDKNLEPSLKLLSAIMNHAKADENSLKDLTDAYKLASEAFDKDVMSIARAMVEKVAYGDASATLRQPSLKELKAMKGDELIALFKNLQASECSVVYSGTLPAGDVEQAVKLYLPIDRAGNSGTFVYRAKQPVTAPIVYFYDQPEARQNIIINFQTLKPCTSAAARARLKLWSSYFGGGFSSLMFQEIREFRSYAYAASGIVEMPPPGYLQSSVAFASALSTQADKTMLALGTLDSLYRNMPLHERNFEICKQEAINDISNGFPSFREIGTTIVEDKISGYTRDPNAEMLDALPALTMNDVENYYAGNVQSTPRALLIVGSKKLLPLKELAKHGPIIQLKKSDIYR